MSEHLQTDEATKAALDERLTPLVVAFSRLSIQDQVTVNLAAWRSAVEAECPGMADAFTPVPESEVEAVEAWAVSGGTFHVTSDSQLRRLFVRHIQTALQSALDFDGGPGEFEPQKRLAGIADLGIALDFSAIVRAEPSVADYSWEQTDNQVRITSTPKEGGYVIPGSKADWADQLMTQLVAIWHDTPTIENGRSVQAFCKAAAERIPDLASAFVITQGEAERWLSGTPFTGPIHSPTDVVKSFLSMLLSLGGGKGSQKKKRRRRAQLSPLTGFRHPAAMALPIYAADKDRHKRTQVTLLDGGVDGDGQVIYSTPDMGGIEFSPVRTESLRSHDREAEILAQHQAMVAGLERDDGFLFMFVLSQLLAQPGPFTVHRSVLAQKIGVNIKSPDNKKAFARRMESLFRFIENAWPHLPEGAGTSKPLKDPVTNQVTQVVRVRAPWFKLLAVTDDEFGPAEFVLGPTPNTDYYRKPERQKAMLWQIVAEWDRLAAIPSGKVSGDWAKSFGMAALTYHNVRKGAPIKLTRKMLFEKFRVSRSPFDFDPAHRHRVYEYFTEALNNLVIEAGVLEWFKEPPRPATFEEWYAQSVELRVITSPKKLTGKSGELTGKSGEPDAI